jgi:rubrerythrin
MAMKTINDLMDTAIRREEEAFWFYQDLRNQVADDSVRETIDWIAEEEKKHRRFLVEYKQHQKTGATLDMREATLYKLAEYLAEPEVTQDMSAADVYLVASHRELRSYHFYTELAQVHAEGNTREMLLKMANEELKHKEKMEYLYSNTAFPQTAGG